MKRIKKSYEIEEGLAFLDREGWPWDVLRLDYLHKEALCSDGESEKWIAFGDIVGRERIN